MTTDLQSELKQDQQLASPGGITERLYKPALFVVFALIVVVIVLLGRAMLQPPGAPRTAIERELIRFSELVKTQPRDPESHSGLGLVYLEVGNYSKSAEELKVAIKLNPRAAKYQYALGKAYAGMARTDDAVKAFQRAIKIDPQFNDSFYDLAKMLMDRGSYDKAIDVLKQNLVVEPSAADTHGLLGLAYEKTRQKELAVAEYREALRYIPDDDNARAGLARLGQEVPKAE